MYYQTQPSQKPDEADTPITPFLQLRRLGHRLVKEFAQVTQPRYEQLGLEPWAEPLPKLPQGR